MLKQKKQFYGKQIPTIAKRNANLGYRVGGMDGFPYLPKHWKEDSISDFTTLFYLKIQNMKQDKITEQMGFG